MEGQERRGTESKRIDVIRPVAIFAEGREGILRGKTRNISTGGCSISLDDLLDIGENVLFRIDLGEGFDPAVQSAQVIWSDTEEGRVGIRFCHDGPVMNGPKEKGEEEEEQQQEQQQQQQQQQEQQEKTFPLPLCGSVVNLNIEKMEKPLRVVCREASSQCITLRTSIPFLETDRVVTIQFQDSAGNESRLGGTLTDVSLEKHGGESVPTINLTVIPDSADGADEAGCAAGASGKIVDSDEMQPSRTGQSENPESDRQMQSEPETAGDEPDAQEPADDIEIPPSRTAEAEKAQQTEALYAGDITPGYVVIVHAILGRLLAILKAIRAKAGPAMGRTAPVMKKLMAAAAAKTRSAGATVYGEISLRLRSRKGQRKTLRRPARVSMRTQAPRHKSVLGALRARMLHILLTLVALATLGVGVWGLVNLFKTNSEDLPPPAENTAGQVNTFQENAAPYEAAAPVAAPDRSNGPGYDLWGAGRDNGGKPAAGAAVEVKAAAAAPAAPAPLPAREPAVKDGEKEKAENKEAKAVESADATAQQDAPEPKNAAPKEKEIPVLGKNSVHLQVEGEILGFKHYLLKDPAGLVIDI
ncbi:MAG: PilZ domain-containing protein, partial [Pseudomonadota bacterium]